MWWTFSLNPASSFLSLRASSFLSLRASSDLSLQGYFYTAYFVVPPRNNVFVIPHKYFIPIFKINTFTKKYNQVQHPLAITRTNRKLLLTLLESYTAEQLNKVPEGFKNNMIWNVAHVIVVQQVLVYHFSGRQLLISDEMVARYRKGTKTEHTATAEEVEEIKELLFSTVDQTERDLKNNAFGAYQEYPTSTGFVIKSLEEALNFNNFHEGIHLGYILAMKKHI